MDYQVFLLSRIQERYNQTKNNAESVVHGVTTTAGLITGAAVIMVAVFAGFAAGRLVPLQQFGFGLAVAVLVDATVVRTVLVPSTMQLLGDRNWYLPSFLGWLPEFRIEAGTELAPEEIPAVGGND
jgi:RND superfamily putative drug exporter